MDDFSVAFRSVESKNGENEFIWHRAHLISNNSIHKIHHLKDGRFFGRISVSWLQKMRKMGSFETSINSNWFNLILANLPQNVKKNGLI